MDSTLVILFQHCELNSAANDTRAAVAAAAAAGIAASATYTAATIATEILRKNRAYISSHRVLRLARLPYVHV